MNANSNVVVRAALPASAPIRPLGIYNGGVVVAVNGAHSDDCSHRFRLKPATDSDRSQPGVPMIPAG
jgi:hypothetical protein